jgi:hypothetical protein
MERPAQVLHGAECAFPRFPRATPGLSLLVCTREDWPLSLRCLQRFEHLAQTFRRARRGKRAQGRCPTHAVKRLIDRQPHQESAVYDRLGRMDCREPSELGAWLSPPLLCRHQDRQLHLTRQALECVGHHKIERLDGVGDCNATLLAPLPALLLLPLRASVFGSAPFGKRPAEQSDNESHDVSRDLQSNAQENVPPV